MRRLSEAEKAEIWDRFEAGESQRSISRRLGRSPSSIRTHLLGSGFRRPVAAHNGTYGRYSAWQVTVHNAGYGRLDRDDSGSAVPGFVRRNPRVARCCYGLLVGFMTGFLVMFRRWWAFEGVRTRRGIADDVR